MVDFKIGKPYSFRDYNCYDYVVDIRADNNIKTKHFKPKNLSNAFVTITAEMQKLDHGLTSTESPENFDIVIVQKDKIYHCGLFYNGCVMHCSRQLKQVVCETFGEFKSSYEGVTFWR